MKSTKALPRYGSPAGRTERSTSMARDNKMLDKQYGWRVCMLFFYEWVGEVQDLHNILCFLLTISTSLIAWTVEG